MPINLVEIGNPVESKPKIFVGIALDRSSSMESIQDSVISNFNEQVSDIFKRSEEADLKVSLVSFASDVKTHFLHANVDSLVKITKETYIPDGMTAMYHAMGLLIEKIEEETKDLDEFAVLFVTVSDGDDNVPDKMNKYVKNFVREKIKTLQDANKWTFVFIGATKDKVLIEKEIGISANNIVNFVAGNTRSFDGSNRLYRVAAANYLDGTIKSMSSGGSSGVVSSNLNFFGEVPLVSSEFQDDLGLIQANDKPRMSYLKKGGPLTSGPKKKA